MDQKPQRYGLGLQIYFLCATTLIPSKETSSIFYFKFVSWVMPTYEVVLVSFPWSMDVWHPQISLPITKVHSPTSFQQSLTIKGMLRNFLLRSNRILTIWLQSQFCPNTLPAIRIIPYLKTEFWWKLINIAMYSFLMESGPWISTGSQFIIIFSCPYRKILNSHYDCFSNY